MPDRPTADRRQAAPAPDPHTADTPPDAPEMGLEDRLARIEEIVRLLDSDSLSLDEAMALYQEGVGHVRRAKGTLNAAELKVMELTGRLEEDA